MPAGGNKSDEPTVVRLIRMAFSWLSFTNYEVLSSGLLEEDDSEGSVIQRMLDGSITKHFKDKKNQYVYRIETPKWLYYLKRTDHQSFRSILRHLLRGRRAHMDCVWEYFAIRALYDHGFRVMEPLAWGEECWLGIWPHRGFLLVKEVVGEELVEICSRPETSELRREAICSYGMYLGRLHGSGFFHPARVHDFILEKRSYDEGNALELTMIDVDFKGLLPKPFPFDSDRSLEALAESCYLFLRVGHRASQVEARQFIRGYRAGLSSCGQSFPPGALNALVEAIDCRLAEHQLNPKLQAILPESPASLVDAFSIH